MQYVLCMKIDYIPDILKKLNKFKKAEILRVYSLAIMESKWKHKLEKLQKTL